MSKEKITNFMKQKSTIAGAIILVIVLGCVAWLYIQKNRPTEGIPVAMIYVDGQLVDQINLKRVTDRQVISLTDKYGVPVNFELEDHKIKFFDVDCPDKICENTGYLQKNLDMASCIPNRTMVVVEEVEITN